MRCFAKYAVIFSFFCIVGCGGDIDNSDANKALEEPAADLSEEEVAAEQELN